MIPLLSPFQFPVKGTPPQVLSIDVSSTSELNQPGHFVSLASAINSSFFQVLLSSFHFSKHCSQEHFLKYIPQAKLDLIDYFQEKAL
jgi:hypothetical protein